MLGLDTSIRTNQLEEKLAAILRFRIAHARLARPRSSCGGST